MSASHENITHYQYSLTAENLTLELLLEKIESPVNKPLAMMSDHTHPHIEVLVCKKNYIQLNSPNGIITIKAGEAAIVPSNTPHHCLTVYDGTTWLGLSFLVRKHPVLECQDLYSLIEPFCISNKILVLHDVPELFTITKELTDNCDNSRRIVPSLHLIYQLCRISEEYHLGVTLESNIQRTHDSNLVRTNLLDRIINTEFMQNITAEDVAQRLHISTRQLARLAKQRYHKSLYQMIVDKRLRTAAEMLRTSNMSAERIAVTVGFSSKNTFWKEFKKKYGVTPAEYRNCSSK